MTDYESVKGFNLSEVIVVTTSFFYFLVQFKQYSKQCINYQIWKKQYAPHYYTT
jgi:hypothetical protein